MRSVVLGFGSTLRGDDGIGPRIAERIEGLTKATDVLVLIRQSLTPDLAHDIEGADRVVFIDASATETPGAFCEQWIEPRSDSSVAMVHFLEPAALLEWCLRAYGRSPQAVLITVGASNFELGEALSPEVAKSIPLIVRRVVELVS
jgi:hydrogenase maturation protease